MDVEVVTDIDLGGEVALHLTDLVDQIAYLCLGLQQFFLQLQHEPVGVRVILTAGLLKQIGDRDVARHAEDGMHALAPRATLPQPRRMMCVQGQGDAAAQGPQVELVVIGHRHYLAVGMTPTMGWSVKAYEHQHEDDQVAFPGGGRLWK